MAGWSNEREGVDGDGDELAMGEFCTGDSTGFVHQGEQSSAKQGVVGIGVLWKDFFDEGHRFR